MNKECFDGTTIKNFLNYVNINNRNEQFVIFDIGSRDCIQSIEFYYAFPNSIIYAFECNPNTIDICKKNIENYKDRIILIEGCVCDYNGTIKFHPINKEKTITTWLDGNQGASSMFKSNGQYPYEMYVQDEITTDCHRLDSIIDKYGISKVDIIWMDIQGAELLALKGMGNNLQNVKYIHTEISHKEIYSGQVMFDELNNFMLTNNFVIKNNLSLSGWQEDAIYENINNDNLNLFDIVIPVGPHDKSILSKQIEFTKKNIIGYRNIYLICYDPTIIIEGCITIDEKIFPFSIDTVSKFQGSGIHKLVDCGILDGYEFCRHGWYLQQLLKLYALIIIPGILERCLIIDCDTFFLKPTTFIRNDKCLYNYGNEYCKLYYEHMLKMDEDLIHVNKSFTTVTHHMMFEKKFINDLINKIEKKHNDEFYNIFLSSVPFMELTGSSEYEIYFNYVIKNHPDKIELRKLRYQNVTTLNFDIEQDIDYISHHWYSRS
jgi:FkbM family methyltransferase